MTDIQLYDQETQIISGASIKPKYMEREMSFYALNEDEMDRLSIIEFSKTGLFSIGSALLSLGAGIFINSLFQGEMSPEVFVLTWFGCPLLAILGLLCLGGGCFFSTTRKTLLEKIKAQTRERAGLGE